MELPSLYILEPINSRELHHVQDTAKWCRQQNIKCGHGRRLAVQRLYLAEPSYRGTVRCMPWSTQSSNLNEEISSVGECCCKCVHDPEGLYVTRTRRLQGTGETLSTTGLAQRSL